MFNKRKDAKLIDKDIPVFNRMIPYMMRRRNESIITLKEPLIMTKTLEFINNNRNEDGKRIYSYFEILIASVMRVMALYPRMNRFIMGCHYYQRNEISCAFVIKTKLSIDDPERNVIIKCSPEDTLPEISENIRKAILESRDSDQDEQEKAMEVLFKFPAFIANLVTKAMMWLDRLGILPLSVTDFDALHSSVFLANLGSIGLNDAPAHHLFEWGTCSLFITSGRMRKEQVVDKLGNASIQEVLNVCFSIDERISEGFYYAKAIKAFKKAVENPEILMEKPDLSKAK